MNTKNTKPKPAAEPAQTPPAAAPPAGKREGLVARIAELRKQLADRKLKTWPPDSPEEHEWNAVNEELRGIREAEAAAKAAARAEAIARQEKKTALSAEEEIERSIAAAEKTVN